MCGKAATRTRPPCLLPSCTTRRYAPSRIAKQLGVARVHEAVTQNTAYNESPYTCVHVNTINAVHSNPVQIDRLKYLLKSYLRTRMLKVWLYQSSATCAACEECAVPCVESHISIFPLHDHAMPHINAFALVLQIQKHVLYILKDVEMRQRLSDLELRFAEKCVQTRGCSVCFCLVYVSVLALVTSGVRAEARCLY